VVNFDSFYGLMAFVKTAVSSTRITNFEWLDVHLGTEILDPFLKCVLRCENVL